MSLQALLDATPDGGTCVIPAGDHTRGTVMPFVNFAQTIDNGDGTGTRTTFHPDGTVDTVEQLTGLPIPPPPEPDPMADMQAQLAAQQALIDELLAALGGGGNG